MISGTGLSPHMRVAVKLFGELGGSGFSQSLARLLTIFEYGLERPLPMLCARTRYRYNMPGVLPTSVYRRPVAVPIWLKFVHVAPVQRSIRYSSAPTAYSHERRMVESRSTLHRGSAVRFLGVSGAFEHASASA